MTNSGWRRFERSGRGSAAARYWAIRQAGARCQLRFGPILTSEAGAGAEAGQEKLLEFADEAEARRAVQKKIRTKQRAGWVEVTAASEPTPAAIREQAAALEAMIADDPRALDNWLVYADFLSQLEPRLGERVAASLARARTQDAGDRARLDARIDELDAQHGRELLGPSLDGVSSERRHEGVVELERRHGMITAATLHDLGTTKFDALVGALFELPAARLLLGLAIYGDVARPADFARAVERVVAQPRPSLRRLVLDLLGPASPGHPWRSSTLQPRAVQELELPTCETILASSPRLEQLELGGPFAAGPMRHDGLRELALSRPTHDRGVRADGWQLPNLRSLRIVGSPGSGPPPDLRQAALPRLERLLLDVHARGNDLVASLLDSPLLGRLHTLILAGTELTEVGMNMILAHIDRFRRIPRFALLDVALNHELAGDLARSLPDATVRTTSHLELAISPLDLAHDLSEDLRRELHSAGRRRPMRSPKA